MSSSRRKLPTAAKAGKMLSEGRARGKKLTPKQKRFFGILKSGKAPNRLKRN